MAKHLRSSFRGGKKRSLRPRGPRSSSSPSSHHELSEVIPSPQPVASKPPESADRPAPASRPEPLAEPRARSSEAPAFPASLPVESSGPPASFDEAIYRVVPESKPPAAESKAELPETVRGGRGRASAKATTASRRLQDVSLDDLGDELERAPSPRDHDPAYLSLSGEFFRTDEDSVPPVIDDVGDDGEAQGYAALSPAALARRARLRRVVGVVMGFAGAISLAVLGKTLIARSRGSKPAPALVDTRAVELPAKAPEPAPQAEATAPEPGPQAQQAEAKLEAPAPAVPTAPVEAPSAASTAEAAAAATEPTADARALKAEALSLLNKGRMKDAVGVSRAAVDADPTDALSYLYLGTALQETGKWKDAREAYNACVRHATKGPINECRAMGGHK